MPPSTSTGRTVNGGSGGGSSQHSTSMSEDSVNDMDNSDANTTTDSLNLTDMSTNSPSRIGGEEISKGKKALRESSESEIERRERKKQRKERKRLEKLARKQAILSANIISGRIINLYCYFLSNIITHDCCLKHNASVRR